MLRRDKPWWMRWLPTCGVCGQQLSPRRFLRQRFSGKERLYPFRMTDESRSLLAVPWMCGPCEVRAARYLEEHPELESK